MLMDEASWLEIDHSRLIANLNQWRALVNPVTDKKTPCRKVKVCAVVKANAYGLGAVMIAKHLQQAGVDFLAVYSPAQATELLEAGITTPLLVLMPLPPEAHHAAPGWSATDSLQQAIVQGRLHLVINEPGHVLTAVHLAKQYGGRVPVHVHIDTGMCRGGLSSAQVGGVLELLRSFPEAPIAGVMSHLATAHTDGSFDDRQRQRFLQVVNEHPALQQPGVMKHLAATAGACRGVDYHFDMVRIGLGMWGYGPDLLTHGHAAEAMTLQPVVRWRSRVVHVQRYPMGETVGYGRTYQLQRDSVLGVVPAGYGDGYPLSLSNAGQVMVAINNTWHTQPVLGRVSMDQLVIDLTELPDTKPGVLVELLSAEKGSPCALPNVAARAGSSEYEIMCRLSPRLARLATCFETDW